jgi:hypothetical protein
MFAWRGARGQLHLLQYMTTVTSPAGHATRRSFSLSVTADQMALTAHRQFLCLPLVEVPYPSN